LDRLVGAERVLATDEMGEVLHRKAMEREGRLKIYIVPYLPIELSGYDFRSNLLMVRQSQINHSLEKLQYLLFQEQLRVSFDWGHPHQIHLSMLKLDLWLALGVNSEFLIQFLEDRDFFVRFTKGLIHIAMVLVATHFSVTGEEMMPNLMEC